MRANRAIAQWIPVAVGSGIGRYETSDTTPTSTATTSRDTTEATGRKESTARKTALVEILSVRTGIRSEGDVPAGSRSTEHDEMRSLRDPRAGPPVELQDVGEFL